MNSRELMDDARDLLRQHFGESAERLALIVHDEICFLPAREGRAERYVRDYRLMVVGDNCSPGIGGDMLFVADSSASRLLKRISIELIPAIAKRWDGLECGFDAILLGC